MPFTPNYYFLLPTTNYSYMTLNDDKNNTRLLSSIITEQINRIKALKGIKLVRASQRMIEQRNEVRVIKKRFNEQTNKEEIIYQAPGIPDYEISKRVTLVPYYLGMRKDKGWGPVRSYRAKSGIPYKMELAVNIKLEA